MLNIAQLMKNIMSDMADLSNQAKGVQAQSLTADLLNDPVVASVIEQCGGIEAIVTGSSVVSEGSKLANQSGVGQLVDDILIQTVGPELGNLIINAINQ
ncbi:hypothetical protein FRC07_007799 [Ceratobasidium sp. 392]|nr:hypothetical protein FRC07_007799 [Ceratobasidium sp. 392]